jgi:hypothetical protein
MYWGDSRGVNAITKTEDVSDKDEEGRKKPFSVFKIKT